MNKFDVIKNKIYKIDTFSSKLNQLRFRDEKIVFTNGCFDVLHRGHVEYLAKAASLGSVLVLGLNADASVKRLKGNDRPLQNEEARALIIASLKYVDFVVVFEDDTPYNLIKLVQPDVLVKGSDYKAEDIIGYDIVTAKGGEIKTINFVEGHSSTRLIDRL